MVSSKKAYNRLYYNIVFPIFIPVKISAHRNRKINKRTGWWGGFVSISSPGDCRGLGLRLLIEDGDLCA